MIYKLLEKIKNIFYPKVEINEKQNYYYIKIYNKIICELEYREIDIKDNLDIKDNFNYIQRILDYSININQFNNLLKKISGSEKILYIENIYTKRPFRKRGFAKELLNFFLEKNGKNFIFLCAFPYEENISIINLVNFYKSCNFELLDKTNNFNSLNLVMYYDNNKK